MWEPSLSGLESGLSEIMEISEETLKEETLEVFGPQIKLCLENPTDLEKPSVEVARVAPTAVVEVEELGIPCGGSCLFGEEDGR